DELVRREQDIHQQAEQIQEKVDTLERERQALVEQRGQWETNQRQMAAELGRQRAELELARKEAEAVTREMPELQQRALAMTEKLAQARAQLRDHLLEIHSYAQQSREDLEGLRSRVQAEGEQVRQQDLDLHRARDEHRLAMAAFRQHLIDWQAKVIEARQALAQDESTLERRQAAVDEQARQIDSTSARLAHE